MSTSEGEGQIPKNRLRSDRFRGFFEHIDGELVPIAGHPGTEPFRDELGARSAHTCPLCGHEMTEHIIDRATDNHVLYCPAHEDDPPREEEGRMNEMGMIRGSHYGERHRFDAQKESASKSRHEHKQGNGSHVSGPGVAGVE